MDEAARPGNRDDLSNALDEACGVDLKVANTLKFRRC
jgi:hypothetical protein